MKKSIRELFSTLDEIVDFPGISEVSPDTIAALTRKKIKEDEEMNKHAKKFTIPLIAVALIAALSAVALGASYFLSPKDIAEQMKDRTLAAEFAKIDTPFSLPPQTSGDYTFQILGVTSGKNLSDYTDADTEKSYVVGAIARADGVPLTERSDIMISPLVAGYRPWHINAFTLGGGRSDILHEGVDYFIFESNSLEIFADHTVYIAAYEGIAPGAETFAMEEDGSIRYQDSYNGPKALFTLPMDASKADPAAVAALLEEIGMDDDEPESDETEETPDADDFEIIKSYTEDGVSFEIRER